MSALVFTLGCRWGHTIKVNELEAKRLNGTACRECYGMLLVVGVRGSVGEVASVTAQRAKGYAGLLHLEEYRYADYGEKYCVVAQGS